MPEFRPLEIGEGRMIKLPSKRKMILAAAAAAAGMITAALKFMHRRSS